MLNYILQVIVIQSVFLMVYDLFLKKETFFNLNRVYLIISALLSVSIPFIRINSLKGMVPTEYVSKLPAIIIGDSNELALPLSSEASAQNFGLLLWSWQYVIYLGMVLALIIFLIKLFTIVKLISNSPKYRVSNFRIVTLLHSTNAFSFFNYIFLGDQIKDIDKPVILKHEAIHVNDKHTYDLLLFELLRIIFWFNPLIYLYHHRITTLHEFIADAKAVKYQDKKDYYRDLLNQVFETKYVSFVNSFYKKSIIKKRIAMLNRKNSRQVQLIKYTLFIPIVMCMLIFSACEIKEDQADSLDLSEYTYTLDKSEGLTDDNKEQHLAYESFLKFNPDYVSWSQIDHKNDKITYSIHSKDEKVPEGFREIEVSFKDGTYYKSYINFENNGEVAFSVIEQAPTYSDCQSLDEKDRKKCTTKKIATHVNSNFNADLGKQLGLTGRQRIIVAFKIDKEGNIDNVKARAPHPKLASEAERVIRTLPKMIPGMHKGKKVVVPYSLPILLEVSGEDSGHFDTKLTKNNISKDYFETDEVPFSVIQQIPTYFECRSSNKDEEKSCTSEKIAMHVNKNFNIDLGNQLGLIGRQRIVTAFKIDKEGNITDVKSRSSHSELAKEAERVIKSLPKMIPGKHNNKAVIVPYSLPIIFEVSQKKD